MSESELRERAEALEKEKLRFYEARQLFEESGGISNTKTINKLLLQLGPVIAEALKAHVHCFQIARFDAVDASIESIKEDRARADAEHKVEAAVVRVEAERVRKALEQAQVASHTALEQAQQDIRQALVASQKNIKEDLIGNRKDIKEDLADYRKETKDDLADYRKETKDDLVAHNIKMDGNLKDLFLGKNENVRDIAILKTRADDAEKYGGAKLTKVALWIAAISAFLALVAVGVSLWQGSNDRQNIKNIRDSSLQLNTGPNLAYTNTNKEK